MVCTHEYNSMYTVQGVVNSITLQSVYPLSAHFAWLYTGHSIALNSTELNYDVLHIVQDYISVTVYILYKTKGFLSAHPFLYTSSLDWETVWNVDFCPIQIVPRIEKQR